MLLIIFLIIINIKQKPPMINALGSAKIFLLNHNLAFHVKHQHFIKNKKANRFRKRKKNL